MPECGSKWPALLIVPAPIPEDRLAPKSSLAALLDFEVFSGLAAAVADDLVFNLLTFA
jgi:hypothetical protein